MKLTLNILVVLTFIVFTSNAQALFGHVHAERQRRQQAENLAVQERQVNAQLIASNHRLYSTTAILSAGVVTSLLVGAAIGSKTKNDHDVNP